MKKIILIGMLVLILISGCYQNEYNDSLNEKNIQDLTCDEIKWILQDDNTYDLGSGWSRLDLKKLEIEQIDRCRE